MEDVILNLIKKDGFTLKFKNSEIAIEEIRYANNNFFEGDKQYMVLEETLRECMLTFATSIKINFKKKKITIKKH